MRLSGGWATLVRLMLAGLSVLCALVILMNAVGLMLPARTTFCANICVRASPAQLFSVLSSVETLPVWSRNAHSCEKSVGPRNCYRTAIRTFGGSLVVTLDPLRTQPPERLTMKLGSDSSRYSVTRTYEFTSIGDRTSRVVLTEQVYTRNPLLRLLLRIFNPTKLPRQDLEDLQLKFA